MSGLFPVTEEMRNCFIAHYKGTPDSLQDALTLLKEAGATQMQSVKLLIEKMNITLKEADEIVLNSKAWIEEREDNMKLRLDYFNALFEQVTNDNRQRLN